MKFLRFLLVLSLTASVSSCYDDFVKDYDHSTVGFAIEKPVRTVIADRDMEIYAGVSIGGKREVDMSDWATFKVDAELLDEYPAMTLLPESYYTLADRNTFRVRKANLPVADVKLTLTDAFYNDPAAVGRKYVLPLTITGSSLDEVYRASTLIVVKYISTYHGTYYTRGSMTGTEAGEPVSDAAWGNSDLSKSPVRDIITVSPNVIIKPGVGNFAIVPSERVQITLKPETEADGVMQIEVGSVDGGIAVTGGSGTYDTTGDKPALKLKYSFEKDGTVYSVDETLTLRQDPSLDLRVETW